MAGPLNTQAGFDLWHRIDTGTRLFNAINRLTPGMTYLLATLALTVIAAADYASHVELMISPFYAIPCFLMDWRIGRTPALIYGVVATFVQWLIGTYGGHPYSHEAYIYWDAFLNLLFYGALIWIVSKLRLALEMEQILKRTDFLTRLDNRKAFLDQLEVQLQQMREGGGTLLIISANLDRFAAFNQEQGYTVGDLALGAVADLMRRKAGPGDLLGRTDNSEFSIARVVPAGSAFEPGVQSLRKQLDFLMLARGWQLNFSVAGASFDAAPDSAHAVVGKMRVLLDVAKLSGKNRALCRSWGADGTVIGDVGLTAGPFMEFEQTGQMFVEPGPRP